jgi:hypothetical protein
MTNAMLLVCTGSTFADALTAPAACAMTAVGAAAVGAVAALPAHPAAIIAIATPLAINDQ